jgi:hypothetical protein
VFSDYIVHVEVTSDIVRAMKKYKHTKNVEDSRDDEACSVHVKNENMSFIFLPLNAKAGTVAHECWHVVQRMMEYMGVELDSETVAYHLGYLVDEVFKLRRNR